MELKRSYLSNVIAFYFTLEMDSIASVADAIRVWTNKFKSSQLKAIIQLVAEMGNLWKIDGSDPKAKSRAAKHLAAYIIRWEMKMRRRFKNVGIDSTKCARATVPFKIDMSLLSASFRTFADAFHDTSKRRDECSIHDFLLTNRRPVVEALCSRASSLPSKAANKGFKDIADRLSEVLEGGSARCNCTHCEKIGDAVIAMDCPSDMRIEHVDQSFNHLCENLKKPHKHHPSEMEIVKQHQMINPSLPTT
jgi:hypothetical protein